MRIIWFRQINQPTIYLYSVNWCLIKDKTEDRTYKKKLRITNKLEGGEERTEVWSIVARWRDMTLTKADTTNLKEARKFEILMICLSLQQPEISSSIFKYIYVP